MVFFSLFFFGFGVWWIFGWGFVLQNSLQKLTFSKVVSAKKQVVQGTMYHFTIEVQEDGQPKLYDAKVWLKPWENFKKLEEFKPSATA